MSKRREKNKPHNELNKQLDYEVKEKEKDESKIQLGKFFYSLAGMVFAGVILTIFMDYDESKINALLLGFAAMLILGIIAWTLVKRGNIKKVRL